MTRIWRIAFIPMPPTKLPWKQSTQRRHRRRRRGLLPEAALPVLRPQRLLLRDHRHLLSLFILGLAVIYLAVAVGFYWVVLRPSRFEVNLCDVYGSTDEIVFRCEDREQAEEVRHDHRRRDRAALQAGEVATPASPRDGRPILSSSATDHYPDLMRILVTGGAGYIGSHTVQLLLARGHDVWVFDNLVGRPPRRPCRPTGSSSATWRDVDRARPRPRRATGSRRSSTSPPAAYVGESVTRPGEVLPEQPRQHAEPARARAPARRRAGSSSPAPAPPTACRTRCRSPRTTPQRPINPYGNTKLAVE